MNGKTINLQIWDTAGTEMFQSLTASYYRKSAGAIVVFDVTDENSFESTEIWIKNYREQKERTKEDLIYLVGNKVDLVNKRVISENKAKDYKKYFSKTKHFTQIIWKKTREVGFGYSQLNNNEKIFVAFYFPFC